MENVNWFLHGLRVWVEAFCQTLWRRNDYYWPGRRSGLRNTAFVASAVADGCVMVVYHREWPSGRPMDRPERSA